MNMIGTIFGLTSVLLVGLLVTSIGFVEQNEYGLVYNWVTKQITKKVVHGGTHLIGFWNSFIVFPATVRTIEFSDRVGLRTSESLHTRTKEGLGLHLHIAFQYELIMEDIPELYELTNIQYEGLFTRIARDQLLEAAAEYEGPEYWTKRQIIGAHMKQLVTEELQRKFSKLWGLQLLVIDLPDRYEKSITMTQVQQQIIRTRESQKIAASIRADTDVMKAEFIRDIEVVQAEAKANATLEVKMAMAEAARRKIKAEAEAVTYARDKIHLSADDTVRYSELLAYGNLQNATFLANVNGAVPIMGQPMGGSFLQKGASERRTSLLSRAARTDTSQ